MLKIIFVIFLFFFLISCSSQDNSLKLLNHKMFSIYVPVLWEQLDGYDVKKNQQNIKVELAISSKKATSFGYLNNLLILSKDLESDINSKDFYKENNIGGNNKYYFYENLGTYEIKFDSGKSSYIGEFFAKYNSQSQTFKFLQSSVVCEKKAYLINLNLSPETKDTKKYIDFIKTFKCK